MGKFQKMAVAIGQKFNQLTVIREDGKFHQPSGQTQRAFLCRCDCGREKRIRCSHLTSGRVSSCGCLVGPDGLHGMSGSKIHNTWRGIRTRCSEKHSEAYLYHDRGISVCNEWQKSFLAFRDWALKNGYEDGLTIDRIDNFKGYEPGNCRFVTQKINNSNRRVTVTVEYDGKTQPFSLLLEEKRIENHYTAISTRIKRGWSPDRAVDTPIRKGNYRRKFSVSPA